VHTETMRRVAIRKRPSGISTWRSLICTSVRLDKTLFYRHRREDPCA
jgi:hypothetical protein